jgi:all-trans-retinol dehydrogenase (NAD+)
MGYFKDKNILITGAGSGLGRRMALSMAREGGHLIVWDINASSVENVLKELKLASGKDHLGSTCDVSDSEQVYAAAETAKREAGPVDILINNAGVVSGRHFLDCSDEQLRKTLGVNTLSLFWTAKAFLPAMIARNSGHIVTVASAAGTIGVSRLADYCASKFAAVGFDESLRAELAQIAPGVKTTVVCPYYIGTGMFEGVRTRFPFLLPILNECYAADRMVDAIRNQRPRLMMPPLVYTVPLLRLLPVRVFDWVASFLGINVSMEQFKGRQKKEGSENK